MGLPARLTTFYLETHPVDAAKTLERLPGRQAAAALDAEEPRAAAAVLSGMEASRAATIWLGCEAGRRSRILDAMPLEVAARILRRVDPEERRRLLASSSRAGDHRLQRLLDYPEGSAGMTMDPNVVSLPGDLEAGEAVRRLRGKGLPVRYYVYVTDREQRLTGVVTLRELLAAPRNASLRQLSDREVDRVFDEDDLGTILHHPGWRTFHALPVTDRKGVLVGVIRYETVRRLEDESSKERVPSLMALGSSMGEAWIRMTANMLEGLSSAHRTATAIDPGRREIEP